jgi:predicted O-linked N-acetylglucosamine transferase (SPINDLY family)
VHLLLDLAGHSAHNRLRVFARKPAPAQASWLGYFATTGLVQMDYFLVDRHSVPPDAVEQFTERLWYLPATRMCFTPPPVDPGISPLPALANGFVTFGCCNNLSKINDGVIALWCRVLDQVPRSRLLLKARQLQEDSVRANLRARFAACGVDAGRLVLEGPSPRAQYLAAYRRIDIALDPFPYTGGATSAEALWMGVPVLTLAGSTLVARQGVSLLSNAGLEDWIGTDAADYVRLARSHAAALPALARLRTGLRDRVLASAVFDAHRFARDWEDALVGMWAARRSTEG